MHHKTAPAIANGIVVMSVAFRADNHCSRLAPRDIFLCSHFVTHSKAGIANCQATKPASKVPDTLKKMLTAIVSAGRLKLSWQKKATLISAATKRKRIEICSRLLAAPRDFCSSFCSLIDVGDWNGLMFMVSSEVAREFANVQHCRKM